jgi:hypothetical protein
MSQQIELFEVPSRPSTPPPLSSDHRPRRGQTKAADFREQVKATLECYRPCHGPRPPGGLPIAMDPDTKPGGRDHLRTHVPRLKNNAFLNKWS